MRVQHVVPLSTQAIAVNYCCASTDGLQQAGHDGSWISEHCIDAAQ